MMWSVLNTPKFVIPAKAVRPQKPGPSLRAADELGPGFDAATRRHPG